jgi:hypothetical protein
MNEPIAEDNHTQVREPYLPAFGAPVLPSAECISQVTQIQPTPPVNALADGSSNRQKL